MIKKEKIERLLKSIEDADMKSSDIAELLGCSNRSARRLLVNLKNEGYVYISRYERTTTGLPNTYYKKGNLKDAPKLKALPSSERNRMYRERYQELHCLDKFDYKRFIPRMDIAAQWLTNPC